MEDPLGTPYSQPLHTGYLFTGLSIFSFICWIAPTKPVVNQLFGVATGLGMSGITFDWAQISYTGSPLVVPWFAAVNIFVGFLIIYWFLVPIMYYTNVSSWPRLGPRLH